jgi:nucleoside-diphosphate-sugar epimerase
MSFLKQFGAYSGKSCLVTGGAGAIGSQLVRSLLDSGASVTVLDNFTSGHLENLSPVLSSVRLVRGSVSNPEDVKIAFASSPHYVFHLAAHFANQNSVEHPTADMITNVVGTQMVLEEARKDERLLGLVYASSSCVLAHQKGVMREDLRPLPETPYGASKLGGENYTLVYADCYKLPATVVRYFNVFGPGEFPGRYRNVIPNFLHRALHGQDLIITGTGQECREFVHVSDAVNATMLAAITAEARGDVFHVGSGNVLTVRRLAEAICELEGAEIGIQYAPRRAWDNVLRRETCFDKARKVLGYEPLMSFEHGLRATWAWLKNLELQRGCVAPDLLPATAVRPAVMAAAASA